MRLGTVCLLTTIISHALPATMADDWAGWLGNRRDSVWKESGIVDRFPDAGLDVAWRIPVANGYSGPAVVGDHVYLTDYVVKTGVVNSNRTKRDLLTGTERVTCYAVADGKRLWRHTYPTTYNFGYGSGPRCTPLVDEGRVYTLGPEGDLLCLAADTGDVIWSTQYKKDHKGRTPYWGFSGHPVIDDDYLFCQIGGNGKLITAFDKRTGEEIWKELPGGNPGYSSPCIIQHGGMRLLIVWSGKQLYALNPENGFTFWSVPLKVLYEMSMATARIENDLLFVSAGGHVGGAFKLYEDPTTITPHWKGTPRIGVYSGVSTPFIEDGIIYGTDCHTGALTAAQLSDGKRLWETFAPTHGGERRKEHGAAFIVRHENGFFLFSETGDLILADLTPQRYREISRFHVLEPTNEISGRPVVWSHPAFAARSVFARNDKELVRVSLAAPQ